MVKKLIMVGTTTQNNQFVNGQSMMFQLLVDQLKEKDIKTVIVDFGKSIDPDFHNNRISGKFQITKLIDNILLIFRMLSVLVGNSNTPVYINTAQSKVGFLRDYIFIHLAKFFKRKVVAHQFGANYTNFYNSQTPSFKIKIKATLDKTDLLIVEGTFAKKQFHFLHDYENKVIAIPNGLPEKIDSTKITSKKIEPQKEIQLLYLSNLIESKGYRDVLEAVNVLVNKLNQNVTAVFAGKFLEDVEDEMFSSASHARSDFFSYLEKNNLQDRVTYHEGLYGEEKAKAFKSAHFFLLPSFYINEGQPVSVLEALAYGCVPIVTNYRLIPDMVNTENGFFVNPKAPAEISQIVNLMIDHPEQYEERSKAGIKYFNEHFTAEKYVENILCLF
ncbi:glycosyltransferase family 4 protein [Kaistella flava (ex Peng et al. 2021)]|uniref:Glycosyltransferase family 4 protein n=1 Tax=Kaistella flava (ex Peng et al. 2021) TaxID=2038776 RepID=A0A7M2Y8T7_9FLAO|nr:glycosyltransferase family 4 protein [Kaistella flava (ex Peng et al. 2021)]QOW10561.1 glycosyltransferase family 4 protein [Kaistella flava (ex Peng et al. 2021)]